jgi:hypothetical protein
MSGNGWRRAGALALAAVLLAVHGNGTAQVSRSVIPLPTNPTPKFVPKFEAWAETRLIMEGLALSNYKSLNRLLKAPPSDNDSWVFARGQALLVAETGNLLLLRPPRNSGRDTWMKLGMDMRTSAGNLARSIGARDYARSKAGLVDLTNACNRCHTTFRVAYRVAPPVDLPPPAAGAETATDVSLRHNE